MRSHLYRPTAQQNAKTLRRNMTPQERHLWYDFLRAAPARFQRQRPIGRYIVDFVCASAKLIVELDGSQHCEPEALARDEERTRELEAIGYRVLRISNLDVSQQCREVCEKILQAVEDAGVEGRSY